MNRKEVECMQFGLCAGLDKIKEAQSARFDYLEPPVNGVAALTDEEFAAKLAAARAAQMPTPAFNLLFPKTLQLLSPDVADADIAAYLERALERVQALGGRVAVFGSGKSRNRPQGMAYADAFRRLTEVTRLTSEVARRYGVTIVIEPLNRTESNMINSLAEGACLVAAVDHPNVRLLADYYHMAKDGEPIGDIVRLGGVTHAHIATREGRGLCRFLPGAAGDGLRRHGQRGGQDGGHGDRRPRRAVAHEEALGGCVRWNRYATD